MILVTGGLGYIGNHTVKQLVLNREKVIVIDDLSFGHLDNRIDGCEKIYIGDIGNKTLLRKIFSKYSIDEVIHFAASADVGESVTDPQKYYLNNLSNSLTLLQIINEYKVKKLVFSSTAAVFGEPEYTPIDEEHPKNPTNPYGWSKLFLEQILLDYEKAYGLRSISLRYFNASGADPLGGMGEDHDPEHHIIPLLMDVALDRRYNFKIFGTDWDTKDGTCVRDYVHVNDLAQAHILSLKALRDGKATTAYNMGNGNGYTVKEVISMVEQVTGVTITALPEERRAGDPAILIASSDKIKRELGYTPHYPDLKTIIETAWNWHYRFPDGYED